MRLVRMLLMVSAALMIAAASLAQSPTLGFHSVACFKVKPENSADFRKFAEGELHKIAQGRVDDGELTAFYLLRAVFPQGQAAECDYVVVAIFPKLPHAFGRENLAAAIKQAGLSITPEDYVNHRNAVSTLITTGVYQNVGVVGQPKKGDYFQVNYMRVTDENFDDYIALEQKVWKPLAEQYIKDGLEDGWSINIARMPIGSDMPYQVVTVDMFPTMDAIFADDPKFVERFHKAHPDREIGTTFQQFEKLRVRSQVKLYVLEDLIAK